MLKAVIIEDEVDAVSLLKNIIKSYCPDVEIVGDADNTHQGEILISRLNPDIVFLDIQLKHGNGFDLLKMIEEVNFQIVFVTAYDEFAIEAFKVNAVDYILKPYSPRDVKEAIERVMRRKYGQLPNNEIRNLSEKDKSRQATITVPNQHEQLVVKIENVIRIEADRSYCNIYLVNGDKEYISKSLHDMELRLSEENFLRTHKSHLINLKYLARYSVDNNGTIVLSNGEVIPISRRRKKVVYEFLKQNVNLIGG